MPPTLAGYRARPARSRIAGTSCTMTCTIAPIPTPISNAANSGLYAEAPMNAPRIAGAPAMRPRAASLASDGRGWALSGATIAKPSVVLCSAKPKTRNAPSASSPTAYAEPMAKNTIERGEPQVSGAGADEQQRGAAERAGARLGDLGALQVGVDRQEAEEPDRERHEEADPVLADTAQEGQEQ